MHNQCLKTHLSPENRAIKSSRPHENISLNVMCLFRSLIWISAQLGEKHTKHKEMPYEVKPERIKGFPRQGMNSVFPLSHCPRMGQIISSSNMLICSTERGSYHIAAYHCVAVAVTIAVVLSLSLSFWGPCIEVSKPKLSAVNLASMKHTQLLPSPLWPLFRFSSAPWSVPSAVATLNRFEAAAPAGKCIYNNIVWLRVAEV